MKEMIKNKKMMIGVVVTLLIAGSIGGYFLYKNDLKAKTLEKMAITFHEVKEIEYGTKDFDVEKQLVKKVDNAKLKDIPKVDTSKLAEVKLTFTLVKEDVMKKVDYSVKIVDTKAPEISLETESKELTVGDEYDIKSNIKSVKDIIDGDIQEVEKKEDIKNGYYIEGNVDNKKAGEYKISVIAVDKNGLKTTQDFTVIVKEKIKAVTSTPTTSHDKKNQVTQTNVNKKGITAVVNSALSQVGVPYVWGGSTPSGFDCSGLIYWAFNTNGYSIPRAVRNAGVSIGTNMGKSQVGDIMITPNHVSLVTQKTTMDFLHEGMEVYAIRVVEAMTDIGVHHSGGMFPLMVRSDGVCIGPEGQILKGNCLGIRRVR